MKKQVLLAFFFTFTFFGLYAQPCPPTGTPGPSTSCGGAPIICSLNGYCTSNPSTPNAIDQPVPFCGTVQNNSWFAFVAGVENITLDFENGNCTGTANGTGLQAAVYDGCGAPWAYASNCLFEISPNTTQQLVLNNLTIGNVYYLMTDGFSGDVCEYTINVNPPNGTTPPQPDPAGPIVGDLTPCVGANNVTYSIPVTFGAGFYNWTLPPGVTILGADDGNSITVDLGPNPISNGQICVTPTNGCLDGAQSCITINSGPNPTNLVNEVLCVNETYTYQGTTYSYSFPGNYTELNTNEVQPDGCTVEATLNFTVGPDAMTPLTEFICQGDFSTTGETTSGFYTYNLMTSLGCDSTVTLDLTVMNPQAGALPAATVDCGPNQVVSIQAVVVNPSPTVSYIWSGDPACMIPPFTNTSVNVTCGGTYTLLVSDTQGGLTCISPPFEITVNENNTLPTADPGLAASIDCNSSTTTLGGPNMSTGPNFLYSWTGPNGFTSTDANPVVSDEGQYCVFVLDISSFCQSTIECVNVTGNSTPPVAAASGGLDISCSNTTSTLSSAGSDADPGTTYSWTGPGGTFSGPSPSVNQSGTYTLTVTNASGCVRTATAVVGEDFAQPTASIAAPSPIDCTNTSVTLDGSGSSGGVTYNWSTGDTGPTTTAPMSGSYCLTVTNMSNGCTAEICENVTDNSTTVTGDIDVQGQITCQNGQVTVSAINVTGATNPTYTWSLDGNPLTGNGSTIVVGGSGQIEVTITDSGTGCTSNQIVNTIMENTSLPTAVASVSGDVNCNNTSVVLNTSGSTTGGTVSATWDGPGGTVDPNNVSMPGVYTLTILDSSTGCSNTAQVTVNADTNDPVANIAQPLPIDCNNPTITLDGSGSASNSGNLNYQWLDGSGTPIAGETNAMLSVTNDGTYQLEVTDPTNGCSIITSETVVDNSTMVDITVSASDIITCQNGTINIQVDNLSGSSNPTYNWTFNSTPVAGGNTATVPVGAAGTYVLEVVDGTTGCSNTASVVVQEDIDNPISIVAQPSNLTCLVTDVNLDGSGSDQGNDFTYQWYEMDV